MQEERCGPRSTKTEAVVKKLRQQSGITVDWIVGPQMWPIIDALENQGPVTNQRQCSEGGGSDGPLPSAGLVSCCLQRG
jgi:peptidoglycan hydrolase-like protein with peptidoglycan-binding domain